MASGGAYGLHLCACVDDDWPRWADEVRGQGADARRRIRPPLTPNRRALPVALLA